MIFVRSSVKIAFAVAPGSVKAKSALESFFKLFSVTCGSDVLVEVLVELDELLVDVCGWIDVRGVNASETVCPGKMPRSRKRSMLAVITCTCTKTSGLALSMSRMIFAATASLSGVSRITIAFCEFTCCRRCRSSSWRSPFTISVRSCGVSVFER